MEFIATEAGFKDGLGGASNSKATEDYHYVLFGQQTDEQHPEYSGIYFEFDSQVNGAVNCVTKILVSNRVVEFRLGKRQKILITSGLEESKWNEFLRGIDEVFGSDFVERV